MNGRSTHSGVAALRGKQMMSEHDQDDAGQLPTVELTGSAPGARSRLSIVTALIWINVAIFAIVYINKDTYQRLCGLGAMQSLAVAQGQLWRLFTAQYLHASPLHLLVNMVALHFLGRPLEERWSARKFFVIYTLCGLCGNMFYAILGTRGVIHPLQPAVGASGCIYGLLGIVAVLFPKAELYIYFLFPIRIRTAAILLGVISFLTVIERGGNYGGEACHLAGLAFGVWWALHGDEWWSATEWSLPWQRPNSRK